MASKTISEEYYAMMREVEAMYDSTTPGIDVWAKMNGVDLDAYYNNPYEAVQAVPNAVITKNRAGDVIGTDIVWQAPQEFNPPAVIDSNASNTTYGGRGYRINGSAGGTSPSVFSSGAKKVGTGTKVLTTAGMVFNTVCAASLGAKLGKSINENFGGKYAWNEADWENWVSGLDPLDQAFFRTLFDIDGTAYLPEDMLASAFKMYKDMGAFDKSLGEVTDTVIDGKSVISPIKVIDIPNTGSILANTPIYSYQSVNGHTIDIAVGSKVSGARMTIYNYEGKPHFIVTSKTPIYNDTIQLAFYKDGEIYASGNQTATFRRTSTLGDYYIKSTSESDTLIAPMNAYPPANAPSARQGWQWYLIALFMLYGTIAYSSGVEGIGDDSRASTQIDPTLITGTTPETILPQLKQNYPQLFDGAIYEDVPQEDGSTKTITYIPVPWPDKDSTGKSITGTPSQDDPQIAPDTQTDDAIKDLIDTLTDFFNTPPTTGDGSTPPTVVPVGKASSLWKIYNPSQAQLDSFGAWLWDSSFVEQIKKLFNDPMQAIIGVHKVFATPSIGGTATIKVGYLDSQVPSDWVDNQYTTIDCGSVNIREYFGNVFDYSPYTKVSLYLPFIGVVDLDVADVMRGSVKVVYHVDVLTGACLADVIITRDGCGGVIYQYSGSAIVTYPVSSGNYMGMVAGVLSVASGIAGTVLSGGALAPALIGGAVGASHLHTDVSKSGGFSGSAGAMGSKIPYLIISRPQSAMADNYNHFTGKPANAHVVLKNCGGMTRVKSVYVGNMNATDEEKDMIEKQLKAGVLV